MPPSPKTRKTPKQYWEAAQAVYRDWADKIGPAVLSALAGQRLVSPQRPFVEAWLTYALYWQEQPMPLKDVIASADALNHDIPTADEVAWALLRIFKRGWLRFGDGSYGLTIDARRAIAEIVGGKSDSVFEHMERLELWMQANEP